MKKQDALPIGDIISQFISEKNFGQKLDETQVMRLFFHGVFSYKILTSPRSTEKMLYCDPMKCMISSKYFRFVSVMNICPK